MRFLATSTLYAIPARTMEVSIAHLKPEIEKRAKAEKYKAKKKRGILVRIFFAHDICIPKNLEI
jgi:hypothetical protein